MNFILKKTFIFCVGLAIMPSMGKIFAQVTIGSNESPVSGALLDLKEVGATTKGLGLPRVALQAASGDLDATLGNLTAPHLNGAEHTGLVVYNVNQCVSPRGIQGVYVWDGSMWNSLNEPPPVGHRSTDVYTGANSYMVAPGGTITIPIARAYQIWKDYASAVPDNPTANEVAAGKVLTKSAAGNLSETMTFVPKIEWQINASGVTGATDVITGTPSIAGVGSAAQLTVNAGSAKGNALVSIKITGRAEVFWSWHIWVTDYNPVSQNYPYACDVFMDRNLGAIDINSNWTYGVPSTYTSFGNYYQWGRKDPMAVDPNYKINFPTAAIAASEAKNLTASIQFPTQQIVSTQDWYTSATTSVWDGRWGHNTTKSAFDPCPWGWRVPSFHNEVSPWNGIVKPTNAASTFSKGWNFQDPGKAIGYYPTSGYKNKSDGSLALATTPSDITDMWSASPNAVTPGHANRFFVMNAGATVSTVTNESKAFGFVVRCVAD